MEGSFLLILKKKVCTYTEIPVLLLYFCLVLCIIDLNFTLLSFLFAVVCGNTIKD